MPSERKDEEGSEGGKEQHEKKGVRFDEVRGKEYGRVSRQ